MSIAGNVAVLAEGAAELPQDCSYLVHRAKELADYHARQASKNFRRQFMQP
jgi:hypothetical protein